MSIEPTGESLARRDERDHVAVAASLRHFLEPSSLAVIGASARRGTIGGELFRNVVAAGFRGPAHPVNRSGEEVAGVPAVASVRAIEGAVDLAVICVPADAVLAAATDALEGGVRALCVISAGFAEVGAEGAARQQQLLALVRVLRRADDRAELPGGGLDAGAPERHVRRERVAAGQRWIRFPERGARAGGRRAGARARARALVLRLARQQGGRLVQRPAGVLGGRRRHQRRRALPRELRQSRALQPDRPPRRAPQAGARAQGRGQRCGRTRRGLPHRGARELRGRGRGALPPGRACSACARSRSCSTRRPCSPHSHCRPARASPC